MIRALLLIILLVLPVLAQGDETIRIETDLVLINATVTDISGRFIPNLKQHDFILREDGQPKEIAHFAAEDAPFAATILIDMSGSMKTRLRRARIAAAQFAEAIRQDDVVSVYGFNTEVNLLQDFSSSRDISPELWEMEARGLTRLYDCMHEAIEALSRRKEQRRAIILISDGEDTRSSQNANTVLKKALDEDISIYTIDIADASNISSINQIRTAEVLKNFSSKTGGQYIRSVGGQQLSERLLEIARELRAQYTLGFYPDKRDVRWHKLTLEVVEHSGTPLQVRARQGY